MRKLWKSNIQQLEFDVIFGFYVFFLFVAEIFGFVIGLSGPVELGVRFHTECNRNNCHTFKFEPIVHNQIPVVTRHSKKNSYMIAALVRKPR